MAGAAPAHRIAAGVTTLGGVMVVIGSFLPWAASGDVRRSSYDLFEILGRFGYATEGPVGLALRWWPLVPFLVAVAIAGSLWGRAGVAASCAVVASGYPTLVAGAVLLAPAQPPVRVLHGPAVTMAGALVLLAGAVGVEVSVRASSALTARSTARGLPASIGAPPAGRS